MSSPPQTKRKQPHQFTTPSKPKHHPYNLNNHPLFNPSSHLTSRKTPSNYYYHTPSSTSTKSHRKYNNTNDILSKTSASLQTEATTFRKSKPLFKPTPQSSFNLSDIIHLKTNIQNPLQQSIKQSKSTSKEIQKRINVLSSHLRACSEEVNNSYQRQHTLKSGTKVEGTKMFVIRTENKHIRHTVCNVVNEVNDVKNEIKKLKEEKKQIENETKQITEDVEFERKMIIKMKDDINDAIEVNKSLRSLIVFIHKRIIKLKEGISNKDKNNLNIKKQVNMVIGNFDNDKCK
jgi:chromosome segregation ATPase